MQLIGELDNPGSAVIILGPFQSLLLSPNPPATRHARRFRREDEEERGRRFIDPAARPTVSTQVSSTPVDGGKVGRGVDAFPLSLNDPGLSTRGSFELLYATSHPRHSIISFPEQAEG